MFFTMSELYLQAMRADWRRQTARYRGQARCEVTLPFCSHIWRVAPARRRADSGPLVQIRAALQTGLSTFFGRPTGCAP